MSTSESTARRRLDRKRRYRRVLIALIAGGVAVALAARIVFDRPLIGEAVYWGAILAALAVWLGTSVSLFDERDRALERRASQYTLTVAAAVLVVGASAARLLAATGTATVPTAVWGGLWALAGVFGLFGAVYFVLRWQG